MGLKENNSVVPIPIQSRLHRGSVEIDVEDSEDRCRKKHYGRGVFRFLFNRPRPISLAPDPIRSRFSPPNSTHPRMSSVCVQGVEVDRGGGASSGQISPPIRSLNCRTAASQVGEKLLVMSDFDCDIQKYLKL
jgi:hypothetical protein